jgi:hypothetical protein
MTAPKAIAEVPLERTPLAARAAAHREQRVGNVELEAGSTSTAMMMMSHKISLDAA